MTILVGLRYALAPTFWTKHPGSPATCDVRNPMLFSPTIRCQELHFPLLDDVVMLTNVGVTNPRSGVVLTTRFTLPKRIARAPPKHAKGGLSTASQPWESPSYLLRRPAFSVRQSCSSQRFDFSSSLVRLRPVDLIRFGPQCSEGETSYAWARSTYNWLPVCRDFRRVDNRLEYRVFLWTVYRTVGVCGPA